MHDVNIQSRRVYISRSTSRAVTQTPPGMVTSNSSTFRSELSKP
jgi:hypothetical protein